MRWQYRNTVLTLCTFAFFVTMYGRLAISPVVPAISSTFDITNTFIGIALTAMWLTYALVQFPSGVLADRFGEKRIILVSVAGTAITSVVIAFSPHFAIFFIGTGALGITAGLHYTVATSLLSRAYDNIGTAIGVHNSGGPAAGLLAPIIISFISIQFNWRIAILTVFLAALPIYVLFSQRIQSTPPRYPDRPIHEDLRVGKIIERLSRPKILFTSGIAVTMDFTWQGIASFLPTFLVQYHGQSTTLASVLFAVYFILQAILQIGVGRISDYYGRDFASALCGITGTAGISVLVLMSDSVAIIGGIVLLSLSMGWGAAVFPRFIDNLSETEQNTGFGVIRSGYMILASGGSFLVGLFADIFGWSVAFGFLAGILLIPTILLAINSHLELGY